MQDIKKSSIGIMWNLYQSDDFFVFIFWGYKEEMKIKIRHMEIVKEGTLIYALVPEIERPLTPRYEKEDGESEKEEKTEHWKGNLRIHAKKEKEIKLLHLGEAELVQQEGEER